MPQTRPQNGNGSYKSPRTVNATTIRDQDSQSSANPTTRGYKRMSFPDKTPEIPKVRRTMLGLSLEMRRTGLKQGFRQSDVAEPSLNHSTQQPGSASVPNGHSRPLLQPHRLRRRLPPERLLEIGELLKTIELGEDSKENLPENEKCQHASHKDVAAAQEATVDPPKLSMKFFAPLSKVIKVNNKEYMVIGDLGSGGSCKVYSALQEGQIVAIKDVTLPDEEVIRANYMREIQMLKKLSDCEQVVRLFDYEIREDDGVGKLLMVMEKGDSDLSTVLQRSAKDWITVRFFWRDMLCAVDRIHKLGIIHQDLKPANFIVVRGRLKLIDFGISDDIGDATSVFRDCAIGTFNYMSPEIIRQSREPCIKTSRASDIWSLGCILYSLAFGKPPFAHIKNLHNRVVAITDPKVEIPYPPDADPDLIDVLKKCLVRNDKERPTAEQLLKHDFLLGPPCVRSTYGA